MFAKFGNLLKQAIQASVQLLRHTISVRTKPMRTSLMLGCLCDLVRSKPELIAENALLRQQLIVLSRAHKRVHPHFRCNWGTILVQRDVWLHVLAVSPMRCSHPRRICTLITSNIRTPLLPSK